MTAYTISIWLCGFIADLTMVIFQYPTRLPNHWQLYPNVPFVRALYLLLNPCTWDKCLGDYYMAVDEFHEMNMIQFGNFIIYGILGLYLNEVVPQAYGVPKHPLFPIEGLIAYIPALHDFIFNHEATLRNVTDDDGELNDEDTDVKTERYSVDDMNPAHYIQYPLVVKDIRKVYPGFGVHPPKVANKNITLKVNSGELFGLLGPNGAGKTTLISQLIGMYPPTLGNAWIGGFDIRNNLEVVQL